MVEINNASQLNNLTANTDYKITGDIDLGKGQLIVPADCSLYFCGGSFYNGTVVGNATKMTGHVKVTELSGSFTTAIRSSYSSEKADLSKLKMLLELNIYTLILDEDFEMSNDSERSNVSFPFHCADIKHIIGEDITIEAPNNNANEEHATPVSFIVAYELERLCGIVFDGKDTPFENVFVIDKSSQERITVENVTVMNIVNSDASSSLCGILINDYDIQPDSSQQSCDCMITVRNVTIRNLFQQANGQITDREGAVSGLSIYVDASALVNVVVDNCVFSEIHCFNNDKTNVVFEDAVGMYVVSAFKDNGNDYTPISNSRVEISNIQGYNFGKRLVKTDCANVSIRNVSGKNEDTDFLCLIGLNASDARFKYAYVQNACYEGVVGYNPTEGYGSFVIDIAMRYTTVENLISKVTSVTSKSSTPSAETGTDYYTFYPVNIQADDVTIRDLQMIGAQTVHLPDNNNIKFENVSYDDTTGAVNSYSNGVFMPSLNTSAVIDGLKVKAYHKSRLIACNYRTTSFPVSRIDIYNSELEFAEANCNLPFRALIDGADFENSQTKGHIVNLTIRDCLCHHAEVFSKYPFRKWRGLWTLENIKMEWDELPTSSSQVAGLCGTFKVYNEAADALTLRDIIIIHNLEEGETVVSKPVITLNTNDSNVVATQLSLVNIKSNCTNRDIDLFNVCWGEYVENKVYIGAFNNYGPAHKGFMVKDVLTSKRLVWSGTQWVEFSI